MRVFKPIIITLVHYLQPIGFEWGLDPIFVFIFLMFRCVWKLNVCARIRIAMIFPKIPGVMKMKAAQKSTRTSNERRSCTAIVSVNGARKRLIDQANLFLETNPLLTKKLSTDALSEEFEPVALESFDFENRQNVNINWTFAFSVYQDSNIKNKIIDCWL